MIFYANGRDFMMESGENQESQFVTKEITDGTWNEEIQTYSVQGKGTTTEYKLRKNPTVLSGLSARVRTFKETIDPITHERKRHEVIFDSKSKSWKERSIAKRVWDATFGGKYVMVSLRETPEPITKKKKYSLTVEPIQFHRSSMHHSHHHHH